jgi:hypothetical protein
MKKEQKLTDLDDNVIDLTNIRKALSTGGKDSDENWLATLNKNTVFLARDKSQQPNSPNRPLMLETYMLTDKREVSSELIVKMPDGQQINIWVPTLEFSRRKELIEILAELEIAEQETEVPNEQ